MRTAVCISGLPREVGETWESFHENLLMHMPNPDVFIHTGEKYDIGSRFFEVANPKKYVIEPQVSFPEIEATIQRIGYHGENHIGSLVQQFYGLKKVHMLKCMYEKEAGVNYDLVVRTRPDFIYFRPITIDLLELDKLNTLHADFAPTMPTEFAIGPNDVMAKYFGIFDWLSDAGNEKYFGKEKGLYTGDSIMTTYLLDVMGVQRAKQKLPASHPCPYMYYRIMHLHKMGNVYSPASFDSASGSL